MKENKEIRFRNSIIPIKTVENVLKEVKDKLIIEDVENVETSNSKLDFFQTGLLVSRLQKFNNKLNNDKMHFILKLDEIVAVYNQNQLKVEQMMAVEEGLLKGKVSQAKHLWLFFGITVSEVDLFLFLFR